jgi:excisionase family DNA binding protein
LRTHQRFREWLLALVGSIIVVMVVGTLGQITNDSGHAQTAPPTRRLYSIAEVAQLLSVTTKHVYALAYNGELPTVKLGRRRLVPAEGLDRFIAALPEADAR